MSRPEAPIRKLTWHSSVETKVRRPSAAGESSDTDAAALSSAASRPSTGRRGSSLLKSFKQKFVKARSNSFGSVMSARSVVSSSPDDEPAQGEEQCVELFSDQALKTAIETTTKSIQEDFAYRRLHDSAFEDPATKHALSSTSRVYAAYKDMMGNPALHDTIHSFVSEKMKLEWDLALSAQRRGEIGLPDLAISLLPQVSTQSGAWGSSMTIEPIWGGDHQSHTAPVGGIRFENAEVRSWFAEGEKTGLAELGERLAEEGTKLISTMKSHPDPLTSPMFEWDLMKKRVAEYNWPEIGAKIQDKLAESINHTIATYDAKREAEEFSGQGEQRHVWLKPITTLTEDGLKASLGWKSKDGFFDGTGEPDEIVVDSLVGGLDNWRDVKGKGVARD
ncbi:hypothetical protein IAR50_000031 [Cryptococcus sp. DSM 104548]